MINGILTELHGKQAFFVIRAHQRLGWTEITPLQGVGHNESGELFEQTIQLTNGVLVRRIVINLKKPTRHSNSKFKLCNSGAWRLKPQLHKGSPPKVDSKRHDSPIWKS